MSYILYKITNLTNNKIYIGQTFRSLKIRWNEHLSSGRKGKSEMLISRAINKYGCNNFKIEQLHEVSNEKDLNTLEESRLFSPTIVKKFSITKF